MFAKFRITFLGVKSLQTSVAVLFLASLLWQLVDFIVNSSLFSQSGCQNITYRVGGERKRENAREREREKERERERPLVGHWLKIFVGLKFQYQAQENWSQRCFRWRLLCKVAFRFRSLPKLET